MKVIAFDRLPDGACEMPIPADILPDSAIIKDAKPFFLPNFSANWAYYIAPAFRICRLGKNVGVKFAERYIDAVAVAIITRPTDALELWTPAHSGLLNIYEGAVIIGDWRPLTTGPLEISVADKHITIQNAWADACRLLSETSRIGTIKIGDILITSRTHFADNLPLSSTVTAALNGVYPCLSVRIK
jgi:hypothetical protein